MKNNADKANDIFHAAVKKFSESSDLNTPANPAPVGQVSAPRGGNSGLGVLKLNRPAEPAPALSAKPIVAKRYSLNKLPEQADSFEEQVAIIANTIQSQLTGAENANAVSLYKFISQWIDAIVEPGEGMLTNEFSTHLDTMDAASLRKFVTILLIGLG